MFTLYHAAKSSASRRVRLCLEEKSIPWTGHEIDLSKQEQHSAEYLKINPNGVVPTLLHDGRPLHESGTICEYLDELFPNPPLRPQDPYEKALMRNWIRFIDSQINHLIVFNWRSTLQKLAEKWTDEELENVLKNVPSRDRKEAWMRVARRPHTAEELDEARNELIKLLDKMEEALSKSEWLVGENYSIADIAAVPFIKRIEEEIAPDEITSERHPKTALWWQKIQARPAFARANIGPFLE